MCADAFNSTHIIISGGYGYTPMRAVTLFDTVTEEFTSLPRFEEER